MGKIDEAELQINGELCPRRGKKDQLFLHGRIKEGRLRELKFMCALCDPPMFVAADILCQLALEKSRTEIEKLGEEDFEKILGGPSLEGYEHFKRARELLVLGLIDSKG
ncbi:hypothetical protein GX441_10565 [bacterium]|nr:hypothetical protein [bacterium]